MEIGQIVKHGKYGFGVVIPSDDMSKAKIMVRFDECHIIDKYVCFDGILQSELELKGAETK